MLGLLENIFRWCSLPLLCLSLGYLLWHHLYHRDSRRATYLGISLLPQRDHRAEVSRLQVSAPLLLSMKCLLIFSIMGLLSSLYWPDPPPKGTVILTQGSVKINQDLKAPVYVFADRYLSSSSGSVLQRINPHSHPLRSPQDIAHTESQKANIYGWSSSNELKPLSANRGALITLPRLTGTPQPLSILNDILDSVSPEEVVYPVPREPILQRVKASWVDSTEGTPRLKIEALMSSVVHKGDGDGLEAQPISFHLERFVPHKSSKRNQHGGRWQEIGVFQAGENDHRLEWSSRDQVQELSGSAVRVVTRQAGYLRDPPYPLCVPLPKTDWRLNRQGMTPLQTPPSIPAKLAESLSLIGVELTAHHVTPSSNQTERDAGELHYYFAGQRDSWEVGLIQERLKRGEVWTPLSPISNLMEWSIDQVIASQALALTAPSLPSPLFKINRFKLLSMGSTLLWLVNPKMNQTLISGQWESSNRVASWLLHQDGSRHYHVGFDLRALTSGAALSLNTSLFETVQQEKKLRSRCYEWLEGEPLLAILPRDTTFYLANESHKSLALNDIARGPNKEGFPQHLTAQLEDDAEIKNALSVELFKQSLRAPMRHLNIYHQGLIIARPPAGQHRLLKEQEAPLMIIRRANPTKLIDQRARELRINGAQIDRGPDDSLLTRFKRFGPRQRVALTILSLCVFVSLTLLIILRRRAFISAASKVVITITLLSLLPILFKAQGPLELTLLSDPDSPLVTLNEAEFKALSPPKVSILSPKDHHSQPLLIDPKVAPLSTLNQSIAEVHRGPAWVTTVNRPTNKRSLFRIKEHHVHRDIDTKRLLVTMLLSTPVSSGVEVDLYINGSREEMKVSPQGSMVARWIPDRGQSVIPVKLELTAIHPDQEGTEKAGKAGRAEKAERAERAESALEINEAEAHHELKVSLPVIPQPRRRYWVWGRRAIKWVEAAGGEVIAPPPQALNQPLPRDLRGVILDNIPPSKLTLTHIEHLRDWVHHGGVLFISGELTERDRAAYRELERGEKGEVWRALTPLNASRPIPKDRSAQIVFMIDRSGSIDREAGGPGIDEVTTKLSSLIAQLPPHDEITLISFGGGVELTLPPTERHQLHTLPAPTMSRGGTELHAALELALTYRRPSLPAHWVIITDGEWGDDPQRLLNSLPERIEASGVNVTIALHTNQRTQRKTTSREPQCQDPCLSFSKAAEASTTLWSSFSLDQLNDPLSSLVDHTKVELESTRLWDQKIGGSLPTAISYSSMGLRPFSRTLVYANGEPVFAERGLGFGRVVQLVATPWDLTPAQWASVLGTREGQYGQWQVRLGEYSQRAAHWSALHGAVSAVYARSHKGRLKGKATLSANDQSQTYRWHPLWDGESVLVNCDTTTVNTSHSIRDCEPLWMKMSDPSLYRLTSTALQGELPHTLLPASSPLLTPNRERALSVYHQTLEHALKRRPLTLTSQPLYLPTNDRLKQAMTNAAQKTNMPNSVELFWLVAIAMVSAVLLESRRWYKGNPSSR